MGKLDLNEDKFSNSKRDLEKLEDDYYYKIMVIFNKFFELEDK